MSLYSVFVCWLIFNELFVLVILRRPKALQPSGKFYLERVRMTAFAMRLSVPNAG
jgi:hypothetical protein